MNKKTFELIDRISKEHSKNVKRRPFGYLTASDLRGEIWQICLDRIKHFDPAKGKLEHFLRRAVKNRLINRFKDVTKSLRSPCLRCPFYNPGKSPSDCAQFGHERHLCKKWYNYQLSMQSRNSLLNPTEPQVERHEEVNVLNRMIGSEIKLDILSKIDKAFHQDIEQITSGGKVSKQRIKRLKKEVLRILNQKDELVQIGFKTKEPVVKKPIKRKRGKRAISKARRKKI